MAILVNAAKVVLLLFCGAGFYATWYLLLNNGSTDHMAQIRDVGPRLLPGTQEPVKTKYIGIEMVDYQLTVLDLFFWELVDGSRPDASLFCYRFAGQVFSGWGLLMVESMRHGNLWRAISFLAIWGVLVQNLAYAVIVPIFLVTHLSTSPTVFSTTAADYTANVFDILSIPISLTLAYVLPTVWMSLPAPCMLDFSTKQNLMAFWQFFPLWVSLLQPLVAFLTSFVNNGTTLGRKSGPAPKASMGTLRTLYALLLVVAGGSQISTLSIVVMSAFFPGLFAQEYVGVMNFSRVFLPQAISTSTKMPSIGDGAFMLLQYDEYIGSSSMVIWAAVLLLQAYRNQRRPVSYASLMLHGIVVMALTGPLGFAVACVWARDELVHEKDIQSDRKVQ